MPLRNSGAIRCFWTMGFNIGSCADGDETLYWWIISNLLGTNGCCHAEHFASPPAILRGQATSSLRKAMVTLRRCANGLISTIQPRLSLNACTTHSILKMYSPARG